MVTKIKINKEDERMFWSVLSTYPTMVEDDRDAVKFNKELGRLKERVRIQMGWVAI